ncbi:MAG: hypothetical protein ABJ092_14320 [Gillisia sp.]
MSFKEIKELRQAGKLNEALQMANQALEADRENIWNKRGAAWVYYDLLKINATAETFEAFLENLQKLKNLELPENEKMVFDNTAFQIGKMIFALENGEQTDLSKVNSIFEAIHQFHLTKPSESYSFLLKAFQKVYKNSTKFLDFADWWNLDNLELNDFQPEEFNGRQLMSLAEKAYDTYSKQLLVTDTVDGQPAWISDQHRQKIESFLPKLSKLITEHPEYQYPPFYKAKLLILLGNEENALSAFIPFALQKKNDFWVWDLMADIFPEDDPRKFACYCKALSLKTQEDFLVKLRQKFAAKLIAKKLYPEAKTEIEKIIKVKTEKGWKISPVIVQWTQNDWYKTAILKENNMSLYNQHIGIAEEILFADIPEEVIVIEYVNRDKKMVNFVKDKNKHGFFKYTGILKNPSIGDILRVRFNGEGKDNFYKALSARNANPNDVSNALRKFSGTFRMLLPNTFGFVEDIFMEPTLVKKYSLQHNSTIEGNAILSFNKKKNEWGWKAYEIN